jgi:hypothetical protein
MSERPDLDLLPDDEHSEDTDQRVPLPPRATIPEPRQRRRHARQRTQRVQATRQMQPAQNAQPPQQLKRRRTQQRSGFYIPLWMVGLTILIVAAIACGIVLLVIYLGGNTPEEAPPVVIVNSPMPTNSPASFQASPATPTIPRDLNTGVSGQPPQPPESFQLFGPTLEAIASSTPTRPPLAIGVTVVVSGVDPDQLNVRGAPGTRDTSVLFRADEGARFTIIGGPQQADGFTWWQIRNPVVTSETGWAVSNYLEVALEQ